MPPSKLRTIQINLLLFHKAKKHEYLGVLWMLFVCLFIVCGIMYVAPILYQSVSFLPQFQIKNIKIATNVLQPFISEVTPVDLPESLSIFSNDVVEKIFTGYTHNPWVYQVEHVQLLYPNHVFCRLQLRKPIAFVAYQDRYYLCDTFGVRLPVEKTKQELPQNFPKIYGIAVPPPEPTKGWNCAVLPKALRLSEFLSTVTNISWDLYLLELPYETEPTLILKHKKWIFLWGKDLENSIPYISKQKRWNAVEKVIQLQASDIPLEIDVRFGYPIFRKKNFLIPQLVSSTILEEK